MESVSAPRPGAMENKHRVLGLSHVNVIVDDIDYATAFYKRTLGFQLAYNDDGVMDYHVTSSQFALDAGFLDGKVTVQVRFLRHPVAGIFIELMHYIQPTGSQQISLHKTNDLGGPRHIALEVEDAYATFEYLKKQSDVRMISESSTYGPPRALPNDFRLAFFYWIDPWGVQWEMEQGRPIGAIRGISG